MKLPALSEFTEFIQYASIGGAMFLVNLAALYFLREYFSIEYYIAVPLAFIVGSVIHYFVVRAYIFAATERSIEAGLLFFVILNILDAAVVTAGVILLVTYGHTNLYIARTEMAFIVGIFNYILNARYNFGTL